MIILLHIPPPPCHRQTDRQTHRLTYITITRVSCHAMSESSLHLFSVSHYNCYVLWLHMLTCHPYPCHVLIPSEIFTSSCSFMLENSMTESPIIYLAPELASHINFFMWEIANTHNFVIQTIPKNIYRYFKTANMSVFEKLKPKFEALAKEK